MSDAVFPRNFLKTYPEAVRGEGCFIFTAGGQRYLDASGGAAVVTIGHGVPEIGRAMAEQATQLAYAHSSQFHTEPAEKLARRLLALAPRGMRDQGRVYFTSGGSEATETALKLARQYWIERGEKKRYRVISRSQSYHGASLGALSVSGNVRRREPFAPMLHEWGHIAPCFCYRCPLGLEYPSCNVDCADELDRLLEREGSEDVAAFIFEPVVGATLGAVAPPDGYVQRIAEICRRHKILLIADEVMSGMGRTGKALCYPALGCFSRHDPCRKRNRERLRSSRRRHRCRRCCRDDFSRLRDVSSTDLRTTRIRWLLRLGMPCSTISSANSLFERVEPAGRELRAALEKLRQFSVVGDVRGKGLLLAIEIVRDAKTREPFPADARHGRANSGRRARGRRHDVSDAGLRGWRARRPHPHRSSVHDHVRDDTDARSRARPRPRRPRKDTSRWDGRHFCACLTGPAGGFYGWLRFSSCRWP